MAGKIKSEAEIRGILGQEFGMDGCGVQVVPKTGRSGGDLYLIEHIAVGRRITLAGVERMVRRISRALDAEPYGTVNVDFFSLGGGTTFDMLAEARD